MIVHQVLLYLAPLFQKVFVEFGGKKTFQAGRAFFRWTIYFGEAFSMKMESMKPNKNVLRFYFWKKIWSKFSFVQDWALSRMFSKGLFQSMSLILSVSSSSRLFSTGQMQAGQKRHFKPLMQEKSPEWGISQSKLVQLNPTNLSWSFLCVRLVLCGGCWRQPCCRKTHSCSFQYPHFT